MAQDAAFQKRIQRIGEIVEQLESAADPNARAIGKELLESLMALHGAALERILEFAANVGEAGETIIRSCSNDALVSSVLLLYGLHPENLQTRVMHAIENTHSYLTSHSASAELVSISPEGAITVRLEVRSTGCGSSAAVVKATLVAALQEAAPDAASITVEETGSLHSGMGFVPVSELSIPKVERTLSAEGITGAGD